jgi:hypothetical protein
VCFGHNSGYQNAGNDVVAMGNNALYQNQATQVIALGLNAGFDTATLSSNALNNSFIVSQQYIPQYPDYATAQATIQPPNAVSGNYYFYYNTTTNSIDAVYIP